MIELKEVYKSYGAGESATAALKGVSLSIADGEFAVILGASGSGKSTLLNVASGLERTDGGEILYDGENIAMLDEKGLTAFRRKNVGFVFQQYFLLPNLNVEKNVRMGAALASDKDYAAIIDAVGLSDKLKKYPSELSGGEQQRVSVARALAKRPRVLFLDEPTGALDEKSGRNLLDYVINLARKSDITMIMVTHNSNIAETADKIIKMNSGEIVSVTENAAPKSAYEIGW